MSGRDVKNGRDCVTTCFFLLLFIIVSADCMQLVHKFCGKAKNRFGTPIDAVIKIFGKKD